MPRQCLRRLKPRSMLLRCNAIEEHLGHRRCELPDLGEIGFLFGSEQACHVGSLETFGVPRWETRRPRPETGTSVERSRRGRTAPRCASWCPATSQPAASNGSPPSPRNPRHRRTTSRPSITASCRPRPTRTPSLRAKASHCRGLPLNCDILVPTDGDQGWGRCADHPWLGRSPATATASGASTYPSTAATGWRQADLHPAPGRWAWWTWSLTVDVAPGPLTITARAWKDTGVTQPESPASLWNPRGYGNNAYAHIELSVT